MMFFKENADVRDKVSTEASAKINGVAVVMVWTRRAKARERENVG